jgi:hypothetical protein
MSVSSRVVISILTDRKRFILVGTTMSSRDSTILMMKLTLRTLRKEVRSQETKVVDYFQSLPALSKALLETKYLMRKMLKGFSKISKSLHGEKCGI